MPSTESLTLLRVPGSRSSMSFIIKSRLSSLLSVAAAAIAEAHRGRLKRTGGRSDIKFDVHKFSAENSLAVEIQLTAFSDTVLAPCAGPLQSSKSEMRISSLVADDARDSCICSART